MADQFVLSERSARSLIKMIRWFDGMQADGSINIDQLSHPDTIKFRNDSSETIPAYGCMRVTGAVEAMPNRFVVTVDKPDGTGGPFLFNGPREIAEDGYGTIPNSSVVKAKYTTGTPAAGETWGPESDWEIVKHGQPAILVYGPAREDEFLIGNPGQRQILRIGKIDGDIDVSVSTEGTVDIWSDGADTTNEDTVDFDWMNGDEDFSDGKEAFFAWFDDEGKFRGLGSECE